MKNRGSSESADEENFDFSAAVELLSEKASAKNARVVDDDERAFGEQIGQIANRAMVEVVRMNYEQTCGITVIGGM